jgi:hypothetical protein
MPKRFKILFISDPTTQIPNKTAANNDLAYVNTTITPEQYNFVGNLQGFVHVLKTTNSHVSVCMQEWVRSLFPVIWSSAIH